LTDVLLNDPDDKYKIGLLYSVKHGEEVYDGIIKVIGE
jgi:hypothetical protein